MPVVDRPNTVKNTQSTKAPFSQITSQASKLERTNLTLPVILIGNKNCTVYHPR